MLGCFQVSLQLTFRKRTEFSVNLLKTANMLLIAFDVGLLKCVNRNKK